VSRKKERKPEEVEERNKKIAKDRNRMRRSSIRRNGNRIKVRTNRNTIKDKKRIIKRK
jgi:hypothetical protein